MRRLPIILLLTVIVVLLAGCETLNSLLAGGEKPHARIVGVEPGDLSFEKLNLVFDVEVSNPYPVALPINGLSYDLQTGGNSFLSGVMDDADSIPAKSSGTLQIPVEIGFEEFMRAAQGVKLGSLVPYTALVELEADAPGVGPVRLPLKRDGEFPLPAPPLVELGQFQFDEVSLSNVAARIPMSLTNTNEFPIEIGEFLYGLNLAGTPVADGMLPERVELAPGEEGALEIPFSFSPQKLGMAGFQMIREGRADYTFASDFSVLTEYGTLRRDSKKEGTLALRK